MVLRDPVHMQRVLEAKEHLTTRAAQVEMFEKLFGSSDAEERYHLSEVGEQEKEGVGLHSGGGRFYVSDAALASSIDAFISNLSASMHDKMFQYDTWTGIEDIWSFLQLVLVRCIIQTLFGSALLKQYPRIVRDYLDFNAATEGFIPGMPRIMVHGAAKPRDHLLQGMKKWVEENRPAHNDKAKAWDENEGLPVIREYVRLCHDTRKFKDNVLRTSAAEMLAVLNMYVARLSEIQHAHGTRWLTKITEPPTKSLLLHSGQRSRLCESRTLPAT